MPESCKDKTVQVETSPAGKDLGIVLSIGASIQQNFPSTTVELEHNIVPPKPTTYCIAAAMRVLHGST
eukprot:3077560-Ditylum_brightwellii.AAC.1